MSDGRTYHPPAPFADSDIKTDAAPVQQSCAETACVFEPGNRKFAQACRMLSTVSITNVRDNREVDNPIDWAFRKDKQTHYRERQLRAGLVCVITAIVWINRLLPSHEEMLIEQAKDKLSVLVDAIDEYEADVGKYPTETEGVPALYRRPAPISRIAWAGPYIDRAIDRDPWGRRWIYHYPAKLSGAKPYDICSKGSASDSGDHEELICG